MCCNGTHPITTNCYVLYEMVMYCMSECSTVYADKSTRWPPKIGYCNLLISNWLSALPLVGFLTTGFWVNFSTHHSWKLGRKTKSWISQTESYFHWQLANLHQVTLGEFSTKFIHGSFCFTPVKYQDLHAKQLSVEIFKTCKQVNKIIFYLVYWEYFLCKIFFFVNWRLSIQIMSRRFGATVPSFHWWRDSSNHIVILLRVCLLLFFFIFTTCFVI